MQAKLKVLFFAGEISVGTGPWQNWTELRRWKSEGARVDYVLESVYSTAEVVDSTFVGFGRTRTKKFVYAIVEENKVLGCTDDGEAIIEAVARYTAISQSCAQKMAAMDQDDG